MNPTEQSAILIRAIKPANCYKLTRERGRYAIYYMGVHVGRISRMIVDGPDGSGPLWVAFRDDDQDFRRSGQGPVPTAALKEFIPTHQCALMQERKRRAAPLMFEALAGRANTSRALFMAEEGFDPGE